MDVMKSSQVYRIHVNNPKDFAIKFNNEFYVNAIVKSNTSTKEKKIPDYVLNAYYNFRKWYFIGFYAADGTKSYTKQKTISLTQKGKLAISELNLLCNSLGFNMRVDIIKCKPNIFQLVHVEKELSEEVKHCYEINNPTEYVYDLSTDDGTFNCGFPLIVKNTDAFILKLKTNDINKDLKTLKHHFDFSNYSKDHPLFSNENKKIPGKFKDELAGDEMLEFAGIRSKMYGYRTNKRKEIFSTT